MQLTQFNEQFDDRRKWLLMTGALAGVGAVATAVPFVSSIAPSQRARARGASLEVDIADLAPDDTKMAEWSGKPVWILCRNADMLAGLASLNDRLVDPDSKREQQPVYAQYPQRSINPEYLVAVGICKHLGCSP
jgi:ubiquinol-cytochrome c reductase iron-sulfur subunit